MFDGMWGGLRRGHETNQSTAGRSLATARPARHAAPPPADNRVTTQSGELANRSSGYFLSRLFSTGEQAAEDALVPPDFDEAKFGE